MKNKGNAEFWYKLTSHWRVYFGPMYPAFLYFFSVWMTCNISNKWKDYFKVLTEPSTFIQVFFLFFLFFLNGKMYFHTSQLMHSGAQDAESLVLLVKNKLNVAGSVFGCITSDYCGRVMVHNIKAVEIQKPSDKFFQVIRQSVIPHDNIVFTTFCHPRCIVEGLTFLLPALSNYSILTSIKNTPWIILSTAPTRGFRWIAQSITNRRSIQVSSAGLLQRLTFFQQQHHTNPGLAKSTFHQLKSTANISVFCVFGRQQIFTDDTYNPFEAETCADFICCKNRLYELGTKKLHQKLAQ